MPDRLPSIATGRYPKGSTSVPRIFSSRVHRSEVHSNATPANQPTSATNPPNGSSNSAATSRLRYRGWTRSTRTNPSVLAATNASGSPIRASIALTCSEDSARSEAIRDSTSASSAARRFSGSRSAALRRYVRYASTSSSALCFTGMLFPRRRLCSGPP
ncbi:hypothetical protein BWI15_25965 [Kribbella sp. ALI-6-A]|nr:hypothetical protein BWI15_25965 [Kribbella sp. ALI-6-A]